MVNWEYWLDWEDWKKEIKLVLPVLLFFLALAGFFALVVMNR